MSEKSASVVESRNLMIMEMEKKLNPTWFNRRGAEKDDYCHVSTSQYWDWLIFIDVSCRSSHAVG